MGNKVKGVISIEIEDWLVILVEAKSGADTAVIDSEDGAEVLLVRPVLMVLTVSLVLVNIK